MTDGRETLQRELEKAAFALMKQRDCKAAIEADYDARYLVIKAKHNNEMSAHNAEATNAKNEQTEIVAIVKNRYDLFKETLRLVDEEGMDPIMAKLTAQVSEPEPATNSRAIGVLGAQIANAALIASIDSLVWSTADKKSKPYVRSNHQRRMANRKAVR